MSLVFQKLKALCSLSSFIHVVLYKRNTSNWWMIQRTPFFPRFYHGYRISECRLYMWLFAPYRLFHGQDYYLYTRLRSFIYCHPCFWIPQFENRYGNHHVWWGPFHWVNDKVYRR